VEGRKCDQSLEKVGATGMSFGCSRLHNFSLRHFINTELLINSNSRTAAFPCGFSHLNSSESHNDRSNGKFREKTLALLPTFPHISSFTYSQVRKRI
jgi:hypothetical protein